MIAPENISRKQAKRLVKLLERETRCEIMARLGEVNNWVDYAAKQIKYKDKIRELLFGTDDILKLGLKWKLLKPRKKKG